MNFNDFVILRYPFSGLRPRRTGLPLRVPYLLSVIRFLPHANRRPDLFISVVPPQLDGKESPSYNGMT